MVLGLMARGMQRLKGKFSRRKTFREHEAEELGTVLTAESTEPKADGEETMARIEEKADAAGAALQPANEAPAMEDEFFTKIQGQTAKEPQAEESATSQDSLASLFESTGMEENSPAKALIALLPDVSTVELLEELRRTREMLQRLGQAKAARR